MISQMTSHVISHVSCDMKVLEMSFIQRCPDRESYFQLTSSITFFTTPRSGPHLERTSIQRDIPIVCVCECVRSVVGY